MHKMWMVIDARRVGFLGAAGVVAIAAFAPLFMPFFFAGADVLS